MEDLARRISELEARYAMDKRMNDHRANVDGLHHLWQYAEEQNVSATQSMSVDLYIPANTVKQIQKVYVRVKLLALRDYDNATTSIVTGTSPAGCTIVINSTDRTTALTGGATFAVDKDELDITQYCTATGYNTIELTSTQLGRFRLTVLANLYIDEN